MKGLLYKNYLCVKGKIGTVILTCAILTVLAVMIALSFRFGNLHKELLQGASASDALNTLNYAKAGFLLCMLLPLALSVDAGGYVFQFDKEASFYKMASALPVTVGQRVLSKYIMDLCLLGAALIFNVLLEFALSLVVDALAVQDFLGGLLCFTAFVLLHLALVNSCHYFLGMKEAIVLEIGEAVLLAAAFVGIFHRELNLLLTSEEEEVIRATASDLISRILDFIKKDCFLVFLTGAALFAGSYFLSVAGAKRKRGDA